MPQWWLQGPMHAGCSYLPYLTAYMYASNSSKSMQPSCSFVCSSRTVGVGFVNKRLSNTCTISMCTIWACARLTCLTNDAARHALAKAAMLWHACSQDFSRVTVYLVVQMGLSRWKVVCCGKFILHWTLDRWQWPSRWANHAISGQKHIDSKFTE